MKSFTCDGVTNCPNEKRGPQFFDGKTRHTHISFEEGDDARAEAEWSRLPENDGETLAEYRKRDPGGAMLFAMSVCGAELEVSYTTKSEEK